MTENPTVETTAPETAEILLDSSLSVLEAPMILPAAMKTMDADGWMTAVVPVPIWALVDSRVEENEESGEDYAIVTRMVEGFVIPVQMSYEVVGLRTDNVLLLKATFELREALAASYDEDDLIEMESQNA